MIKNIFIYAFIMSSICHANECELLQGDLYILSKSSLADVNAAFLGNLESKSKYLDRVTEIHFLDRQLNIPFIGYEVLEVNNDRPIVYEKTKVATIVAELSESEFYKDIVSEFLNISSIDRVIFDQSVSEEWLTQKGFEHKASDFNCNFELAESFRVFSYLYAKSKFASKDAEFYRVPDFDIGYARYFPKQRLIDIVIQEEDRVLDLTLKVNDAKVIEEWLEGISKKSLISV